ncbi:MAG: D-2-hydroxyacid dehydrogenase [Actinomycetota bacterium]|nr:D-2-hydroxyacid dehydrogenase [Actinomycetota bacterium]
MSAAWGTGRPPVVVLVFPAALTPLLAESIRAQAASAGISMDLRSLDSSDVPSARPAGAARKGGSMASRRGHELLLDDEQRATLAEADVLVGFQLPSGIERLAPRARFVQSTSAGVGRLVATLRGTSIRLASAAGLSGDKVAEFAMARLLTVWSGARTLDSLQRARRWAPEEVDTSQIAGRTVLVAGTGGIGQAFARRATAFDLRCVGVRRRPELGTPAGFERVVGPDQWRAELPGADAVVLALPATDRTARLVGAVELAAMKRGAVLCNVARGALVDEEALVAALTSGHLGAAVLDVTAREPLSRRSPLWRAPNVYLSPHVANDWRPEYLYAVARLVVENVARELRGEQLVNLVDLAEGY